MCKPDPFPRLILAAGTPEKLEDPFQILLANATTVVTYLDADRTTTGGIGARDQSEGRSGA